VMAEFGLDAIVICADDRGHVVSQLTVRELLPMGFTPESLPGGRSVA
jgi:cytidine deaminase